METRRLLVVGLVGTAITAICCFTPVLVVLVAALGLSGVVGVLDYVLFPLLAAFVGITIFAWIRHIRAKGRTVENGTP